MTNVLILGAAGSVARVTTRYLLDNSQAQLTLYLRNSARLQNPDTARVTLIEGDVLDYEQLRLAMNGKDIVYANLSGNMKEQAETIVRTMKLWFIRSWRCNHSSGTCSHSSHSRAKPVLFVDP